MSTWSRRVHRVCWIAALLAMSLPTHPLAAAPAPAAATEPSFLIESIDVRGLHLAPERIVISESRLVAGSEYPEGELRQAMYRINRLPFVIQARFSLAKGSVRDAYVLVIEVDEAERFFFGLELAAAADDPIEANSGSASAGIRQFVGTGGVLFGSVTESRYDLDRDGSEAVSVGYTQYDLFGRPLSLTLSAGSVPDYDSTSFGLELGWQLPHSQSLRLGLTRSSNSYDYTLIRVTEPGFDSISVDSNRWSLDLVWRRDTSDDLLFPTAGRVLESHLGAGRSNTDRHQSTVPTLSENVDDEVATGISLTSYRPLTGRTTIGWFAELSGFAERSRSGRSPALGTSTDTSTQARASLGILHAFDIWRSSRRSGLRDLRWQSSASLAGVHTFTGDRRPAPVDLLLSSSLVLRNRWGVFRISFAYGVHLGDL